MITSQDVTISDPVKLYRLKPSLKKHKNKQKNSVMNIYGELFGKLYLRLCDIYEVYLSFKIDIYKVYGPES